MCVYLRLTFTPSAKIDSVVSRRRFCASTCFMLCFLRSSLRVTLSFNEGVVADDRVPDVSMVALSLDTLSVKVKVKNFVLQVIEASEARPQTTRVKPNLNATPHQGMAATPSRPPVAGIVEVYSKIRNYEAQVACVLTDLSARIVTHVTSEHVLKRGTAIDAAATAGGNTAL